MSQLWSPLSQVEATPDRAMWFMCDGPHRIAVIRRLVLGPRRVVTFRAVTWAVRSEDRVLLGYFPDLEFCAAVVWAEWKRSQGIPVPPLLDIDQ